MDFDDGESISGSLFYEPDGFRVAEKPATYTTYTTASRKSLRLRLVGHNPLWGHYLWNGGQILASYIEKHASEIVKGKNVLELGAGAGLPSLVAGICGARNVVVTDYPDAELIENLEHNVKISRSAGLDTRSIIARGYLWGTSIQPLLSQLQSPAKRFDTILLADLLFNHHCHDALVSTVIDALAHTPSTRALVFFTPYRPWLLEKDMAFFDLCRERGLTVRKVIEKVMDKVMFEEDRGDELLRRTVFGYDIRWECHINS
ncbi:Protein N-terminal and lysine N-methyltransferase efm7 [Lecanora helva]